ncbi:hypothetical protein K503DRAFT_777551, partial [Rhizopogon vinicolor AM-OR11-026]
MINKNTLEIPNSGELNSTYGVFPLEKTFIPPPDSISCLVRSPHMMVAPFPLMEAQAGAIVRAFSYPASLDTITEAVDIIARAVSYATCLPLLSTRLLTLQGSRS